MEEVATGGTTTLPEELQAHILCFLEDGKDLLLSASLVCKLWRQIIASELNDETMWRRVCQSEFGLSPSVVHCLPSWKEFYKTRCTYEIFALRSSTQMKGTTILHAKPDLFYDNLKKSLEEGWSPHVTVDTPARVYLLSHPNDQHDSFLSKLAWRIWETGPTLYDEANAVKVWSLLVDWGANKKLLGNAFISFTAEEIEEWQKMYRREHDYDELLRSFNTWEEETLKAPLKELKVKGIVSIQHLYCGMTPSGLLHLFKHFQPTSLPRNSHFLHSLFRAHFSRSETLSLIMNLLKNGLIDEDLLNETEATGQTCLDVLNSCKATKLLDVVQKWASHKGWNLKRSQISFMESGKSSDILIKETIGKGFFSTVYAGSWKTNQKVAIKTIGQNALPKDSQQRAEAEANLSREASMLSKLIHPNVIKYIGYDQASLLLELMPNGDLHTFLHDEERKENEREKDKEKEKEEEKDKEKEKGEPLTHEDKVSIALQIARGMAYVHTQGIIHSDLHTGNILLDMSEESPSIRLSDFGCARTIEKEQADFAPGYEPYLSPERIKTGKATQPGDVWSYGVILWELFSGEDPIKVAAEARKEERIFHSAYDLSLISDAKVKDLILLCWTEEEKDRITFEELVYHLLQMV